MWQPPPRSTLFPYTTLFRSVEGGQQKCRGLAGARLRLSGYILAIQGQGERFGRSEEHTSELQSRGHLVCRLLLEKKNGDDCEFVLECDLRIMGGGKSHVKHE